MSKPSAAEITHRNIRLFVLFRMFFNARFYYPVFAVIYLDFGMTLEQFAILNSIWAVTILIAEVPSGALSDLLGRKKLLVTAGVLMVTEMLVWAFAPTNDLNLLFWILAINRIFSGLAEAAASGSDEALVYDSLEEAGEQDNWANVLQKVTRWQSVAFMVALITGGIVYDQAMMQKACDELNLGLTLTQEVTMRWPIFMNLVTAVLTLIVVCSMKETAHHPQQSEGLSVGDTWSQTWKVGAWILKTPFALIVIIAAATLDSAIRMFITMNSEYYRLISYPAVAFGVIGSVIALQNIFVAKIVRKMTEKFTANTNFLIISALVMVSFLGIRFFIPYVGVIFSMTLFAGILMTGFCTSFYLNKAADMSFRATLLSFKGLALNVGYGAIGLVYAALVNQLRTDPALTANSSELFKAAAQWFPLWFGATVLVVIVFQGRLKAKLPD